MLGRGRNHFVGMSCASWLGIGVEKPIQHPVVAPDVQLGKYLGLDGADDAYPGLRDDRRDLAALSVHLYGSVRPHPKPELTVCALAPGLVLVHRKHPAREFILRRSHPSGVLVKDVSQPLDSYIVNHDAL